MGYHDLVLDRRIRDWVLIPLTVFIVLMKLLMQYFHLMSSVSSPPLAKDAREVREGQLVGRSQRIRQHMNWLPEGAYRMRREYFVGKDVGVFQAKPVTKPMHETLATDPSFMVDMMKKNLTGVIPQLVMGTWVSFFFSGFVMGRVPFGLSPRFRPMLQRGLDLASLDVSYFTSLSYYIMLLFALRGPFSLAFAEDTVDEAEVMRRQMNPMASNPAFDATAAFNAEKSAFETADHVWALADAEERALEVLRTKYGGIKHKPKRA